MEVQEYIEKKKIFQKTFLNFVEDGNHACFQKILKIFSDLKMEENPREMKSILQIINSISENHHRTPEFFSRIEKVLLRNYNNIKRTFSNKNEFDISLLNKRIVLFLIEEGYMTIKDCSNRSHSFASYFYPELESTLSNELKDELKEKYEELREKKINMKKFNEFRKIGENNSKICTLIRGDSIDEFISYVNQENISLSSKIKPSVFETNSFLIEKELSLIEYAAFFGSIQIFKYLYSNNAKLTSDIWPCAIHSNNAELVQFLFDKKVDFIKNPKKYSNKQKNIFKLPHITNKYYMTKKAIKKLLIESIICHHNEIYKYLKENLVNNEKEEIIDDDYIFKDFVVEGNNDVYPFIFKSFNYDCFPSEFDDQNLFFYLCAYDYGSLVEFFLKNKDVDINAIIISKLKI